MRKDTLSGNFIIYQPEVGQRYSTDDFLTAWLAVREFEILRPSTFLDLGSGLCSVPMMILWKFTEIRGTGIEIRKERYELGLLSLKENNILERFNFLFGNLAELRLNEKFDAITSTPPYYEKEEGFLSPHSDKAAARFELKCSIYDYFKTAAYHLKKEGIFITVYPFLYKNRVFSAAKENSLYLIRDITVIPKEGKKPLISLFSFSFQNKDCIKETIVIRDAEGKFTAEYNKAREFLGFARKEL